MNIEQAKRILAVTDHDDNRTIKLKYRQLIGKYHPDSIGAELPEYTKKAQEINEAYKLLKNHIRKARVKKDVSIWNSPINEYAFAARNIYMPYSMDIETSGLFQTIAKGKYMWNPDEEEFDLFLRSLNHVSYELLTAIEIPYHFSEDYSMLKELRFQFQVPLFQMLTMQYIDPLFCLDKLAEPEQIDLKQRKIYHFRAFLSAKGSSTQLNHIASLKKGDIIYPISLQNNRIMVASEDKQELGHLKLEEDALYFCLIPLIKHKKAQVKLIVSEVFIEKKRRPYQAKTNIELYIRLENDGKVEYNRNQNAKIKMLLSDYEKRLRHMV